MTEKQSTPAQHRIVRYFIYKQFLNVYRYKFSQDDMVFKLYNAYFRLEGNATVWNYTDISSKNASTFIEALKSEKLPEFYTQYQQLNATTNYEESIAYPS